MKNLFLTIALLLTPSLAIAQSEARKTHKFNSLGTLLNGVALNASAAARTFTVETADLLGMGLLVVFVDHGNTAATDVQLACTASDDGGTTDFAIQSCAVASGNCTSSDQNHTKAVSADDDWVWRIDVLGFIHVECVVSGTSGGGSDTITATGYTTSL